MRLGATIAVTAVSLSTLAGHARGQAFTEGFEGVTGTAAPTGWVQLNQSGSVGTFTVWQAGTAANLFPAHGGSQFFFSNFDAAVIGTILSNWLLTPQIATISNGDTFAFWGRSPDDAPYADRLQVRMSLAGASTNVGATPTEVGDFTTLLLDINPTYVNGVFQDAWTLFSVTVAGITPASGRFAFRHFIEDTFADGDNAAIDDVAFTVAGTPTGACCNIDGTCTAAQTSAQCTGTGGTYGGNGSTCSAATCPTGACCLPDGSCAVMTSAGCATQTGVYQGNGAACGACPQPAGALFNNGFAGSPPIPGQGVYATGATSVFGEPAPAGTQWSELQHAPGSTCANNVLGFNAAAAFNFRIADDFTVPAGGWTVQQVLVYMVGSDNTFAPGVTGGTLQIWNGRPGDVGSTVVFGDSTTNRFASVMFDRVFRIAASEFFFEDTDVPVFRVALNVNTSLPAGTYWLDFAVNDAGNFAVSTTIPGARSTPSPNARQLAAGVWADVVDDGFDIVAGTAGCGNVNQDMAFVVLGTGGAGPACYANCDSSTATPILNVADFTCFLTKYAGGDPYANCDSSTAPPTLNVADFTCFLTKYAGGCP